MQVTQRTGFTGSALVRLLTRLTDVDVPESRQSFSDRLSQWLRWTDAIALSSALDGEQTADAPSRGRVSPASTHDAECARVRAALVKAIAEDAAFLGDKRTTPLDTQKADFSPYRVRYVSRQQAMEVAIGPLRARLRKAVAAKSPAMARLAAVDAVVEQALGAQERNLLATIPALLEQHFRRLRQSARAAADEALATSENGGPPDSEAPGLAPPPAAWLDLFCKDMHAVMLAELDIRLQPIEGLREALRAA